MLELIRYYSQEVVIREEDIRYVFDHSAQGSKLRQFVIDQLRYDLQGGFFSGYACAYFPGAGFAEVFGPVFLETSLQADGAAVDPHTQKEGYLEVLTDTEGE